MFSKMRRFWNVRAMPSRALAAGVLCVMSSPARDTRPSDGRCSRLMTLNNVVLPAPLGPMSATICPVRTVMLTWLTARRPPKSTETPSTLSSSSPFSPALRPSSAMSVPESGSAAVASRLCSGT